MSRGRRAFAALAAGLALAGCIEREEKITVEADGTVRIAVRFETESFDEMYEGDAVPAIGAGWLVIESEEERGDGTVYRLTADAVFGPDDALPANFASPRDPDPDLWTHFPTAVTAEDRRDGTYYHFTRRYAPRPWARLESERAAMREHLEKVQADTGDVAAMTGAERAMVAEILVRFEMAKTRVFARAAYRDTLGDLPQDLWLDVRAALAEMTEAIGYEELLDRILTEEGEMDPEATAAEDAALHEQALETMRRTLREAGLSESRLNTFLRRYEWHVRYDEITEELADDQFTVEVTMPGVIVGHNAGSADGATARWTFGGEQFRDRPLELMVTSRLAR